MIVEFLKTMFWIFMLTLWLGVIAILIADFVSSRKTGLADVLLAIGESEKYTLKNDVISITPNGQFLDLDSNPMGTNIFWDLSQDLDHQSDGCLEFLHGLLK